MYPSRKAEISGVPLCYKPMGAPEEAVITGTYVLIMDLAAATMRLSMRLANSRGEYDSP